MAYAEELRGLAQEMASAYQERLNRISAIKQETADLLGVFGKGHQEMAHNMRAELAKFKSDLDAAEGERKKADGAEVNQRSTDINNLLSDFDAAHQEMANNLRAELAKFKSDLDAAEGDRKKADQAEIRERKWAMSSMLDDFRKEREDAAAAWKGLLANMQTVKGQVTLTGPTMAEAAVEVKPVEEAELEEEQKEELRDQILGILEDNPDGLRMVEIADILGIENWRTLIPIMRELLDDGEIRKEGTLYFVTE